MEEDIKKVLVYKTYHPVNSPKLYGEQFFMHSLLENLVEERESFEGLEGAIVSVRICDNWDYIDQLNEDLNKLKWCILILTGNENSTGFYRLIKHPNCKIWLQTPNLTDQADYFLGFGYPSDTSVMSKYANARSNRQFSWSYSGQVNNQERQDCTRVLATLPNGFLKVTGGFSQGLEYYEYLIMLAETKFAPCPSAIATPDSFRIYEALEMGCVPVLDRAGIKYFNNVWGKSPIPFVNDWDSLDINFLLKTYKETQFSCLMWWNYKKLVIVEDLFNQILEIS